MKINTMRIGFIGAGNMARAIAGGLVRTGLSRPELISAADPDTGQRERFKAATGAATSDDNAAVAAASDVIVLATKPFQVANVCTGIRPHADASKLFVSICAGITTATIDAHLGGSTRVVRVMPNTPALVGCGATAIAGGAQATAADMELAAELFRAVGVVVTVAEEKLDLVTGLTGSGPAYVYLLGEALIDAAQELGLAADDADLLVRQLLRGAGLLAAESPQPLRELRGAVTTKGGTTEAGLCVLEEGGFRKLLRDCVARAAERSRELSAG